MTRTGENPGGGAGALRREKRRAARREEEETETERRAAINGIGIVWMGMETRQAAAGKGRWGCGGGQAEEGAQRRDKGDQEVGAWQQERGDSMRRGWELLWAPSRVDRPLRRHASGPLPCRGCCRFPSRPRSGRQGRRTPPSTERSQQRESNTENDESSRSRDEFLTE